MPTQRTSAFACSLGQFLSLGTIGTLRQGAVASPYPGRVIRRTKLADVAQRAGVSVSAVSLVMTGKDTGNIAPTTRERILTAARELDYRPNSVAQSLRRQRSHAVGLVTDSIASSPFAGRIVGGAMDIAAARGYVLLLLDSQSRREREVEGMAELARRQVDGFLYASMAMRVLPQPPSTNLPLVLANCHEASRQVPAVVPDDVGGGRRAAEHLLGLGHRRIVMLSVAGETAGDIAGPLRAQGFTAALTAAGVGAAEAARTVRPGGWDMDDGYRGAMAVLADASGGPLPAADRPTAIFAANDRSAAGVVLAAARLGLQVPQDLSVVGFDDQEFLAERITPPLTTCALPHRAMGEAAATLLLDALRPTPAGGGDAPTGVRTGARPRSHEPQADAPADGNGADTAAGAGATAGAVRLIPCPLIERESTAPPA